MAATDVGTGAITAATMMAFSFGGVSIEHVTLGSACYVVGSACRFGLRVSSALENGTSPKWAASVATLSISPFLAAFASMAVFFGAHIIGFEGDAAIGLLLALAGFRGSEGIQWLVSIVTKFLPEKLGGGAAPANQEMKP